MEKISFGVREREREREREKLYRQRNGKRRALPESEFERTQRPE